MHVAKRFLHALVICRMDVNDEPGIIARRRRLIAVAIDEIDEQIAARRWLHERFRNQIEEELKEVVRNIAMLPSPWVGGYLIDREGLRMALHKNAVSRKREMRQEELKLWDDLGRLLEKRRELERELQALNVGEADEE